MRTKRIVFVLVVLSLLNAADLVQGVPIILSYSGQSGEPPEVLPIRTQHVTVLIDNGYVVTNVSQEFYNPHNEAIQGTYLFAIPENAFISNFSLTLEGVKHYGKILPKEQAHEEYQEAVEAGRTAALLEYIDRKMFAYAVSLAPSSFIEVELVYEQFLRKRFNTYTYVHPLETKGYDTQVESLVIDIEIHSQSAISNIQTQGFDFSINKKSMSQVFLHYAREKVQAIKDLVLTYDVATVPNEGLLFITNRNETNYFMYAFAPVLQGVKTPTLPKDIIFVMDKSGSMSGEKIEQTKEAMHNILPHLNPDDRFTVIFFADYTIAYSDGLRPADNANIREATSFIKKQQGSGGTDIKQALLVALNTFPSSDRLKIIFFLTDGRDNRPGIVESVSATNIGKNVQIFSFGFGWDVNMNLLDQISTKTNAKATRIHPSQSIEDQLSNFFETIEAPLLQDISIDYGGSVQDIFPKEVPALFNGSEIIIVGKYLGTNPMRITVTADSAQGQQLVMGEFDIIDSKLHHSFVPKLWAIHRINYLLDQMLLEGEISRSIEEIKQLSIEFGLVTPYTSILIDPESVQEEISQERILNLEGATAVATVPEIRSLSLIIEILVLLIFPWSYKKRRQI